MRNYYLASCSLFFIGLIFVLFSFCNKGNRNLTSESTNSVHSNSKVKSQVKTTLSQGIHIEKEVSVSPLRAEKSNDTKMTLEELSAEYRDLNETELDAKVTQLDEELAPAIIEINTLSGDSSFESQQKRRLIEKLLRKREAALMAKIETKIRSLKNEMAVHGD